MEVKRENAPIILTGFSGAGKSTIGQSLAFKLKRKFFDLDKEIELLSGMNVENFFETRGEAEFRRLESQILNSLLMTERSVIALGGGALLDTKNVTKVLEHGFLIYLKKDLNLCLKNIEKSQVRPLLLNLKEEQVVEIFEERKSGYEKAHLQVSLGNETPIESVDKILEGYKSWRRDSTLN